MDGIEDIFDPGLQVNVLMNVVKFKRFFFDKIGLLSEVRIEATRAIIKAADTRDLYGCWKGIREDNRGMIIIYPFRRQIGR